MKSLLTALLLLLVINYANAQLGNETITKGDNIIIIDTSTSGDSSFIICSKYLAQKGYAFQSRDQGLGQIITDAKPYAGSYNYKLNIICIGKQIKIRATVQLMSFALQLAWTDWSYAKSKGNLMNNAFSKFYPDIVEMKSYLSDSRIHFTKE